MTCASRVVAADRRTRSRGAPRRLAQRRLRLRGAVRDERGSGLIEFAILLPVLVMLLLGIVSAGNAYQQKLSLTNGAREGARYGATLDTTGYANLHAWLDDVSVVASKADDDGLGPDVSGRVLCVAYVYPAGTADTPNDMTTRRYETSSGPNYSNDACFADGRPRTEKRVQVQLQRDGEINAALFDIDLTLSGKSVARFEDRGT